MAGQKTFIKGYKLDAQGRLVVNKKAIPANKRIASNKRKKVVTRAQAIGIKRK